MVSEQVYCLVFRFGVMTAVIPTKNEVYYLYYGFLLISHKDAKNKECGEDFHQ